MHEHITPTRTAPPFDRRAHYLSDCGRRRCSLLVREGHEPPESVESLHERRTLSRVEWLRDEADDDALLIPEHKLRARLGISRTVWWRMVRDGAGPPYVTIGHRRYYRPGVVSAWIEGKTSPRGDGK